MIVATRYTVQGGLRTQVETFDGQSTATDAGGVLTLADPAITQRYAYDKVAMLFESPRLLWTPRSLKLEAIREVS